MESDNDPMHHDTHHHYQHRNDEMTARESDQEEQQHFESVCQAYRQYAPFAMAQRTNRQCRFQALPESQRKLLPSGLVSSYNQQDPHHDERASAYKDAVIRNQFCLDCILRHAGQPHSQESKPSKTIFTDDEQISKVSSVLKSLVRDWSTHGKAERDAAYVPILGFVEKYVKNQHESVPKICVPGSGVGRLALEIRAGGYTVQGNDFSLYMLLASDFILNNGGMCSPERPLTISPWLLEPRNLHTYRAELRTVSIPDVDPVELLQPSSSSPPSMPSPDFSMAAGDFCAIYGHEREACQWDCVASCFFLDACPNIIETLQVVYRMLRPGGFLINLGPLLYHWSGPMLRPDDGTWEKYRERHSHLDERYMTSISLAYEDVKEVMINIGFEILEEHVGIECLYTADRESMMTTQYRCVSFVARKKT